MVGGMPSKFEEQYQCFSFALVDKAHLEVSHKLNFYSDSNVND